MKQESTVTKKGQVTIPKVIRDKLGLKKGTKVYFELRGNVMRTVWFQLLLCGQFGWRVEFLLQFFPCPFHSPECCW